MRIVVVLIFLALAGGVCGQDMRFEVTVQAGAVGRIDVPVVAEFRVGHELSADEGDRLANGVRPRVDGMERVQAEVVPGPGGTVKSVRVCWIEPGLPAESKKTFAVKLEPECACEVEGFRFDEFNTHRELRYEQTPIYEHVTTYDARRHDETFNVFHQLYGLTPDVFITKGAGGDYPHHRGLFLGFNTQYGNFWTGDKGVSQRHLKYYDELVAVGVVSARSVGLTEWKAAGDKTVARDTRDVRAWWISEHWYVLDFDITLEAVENKVTLGGDAQHAGFHFRAPQEVSLEGGKTGSAQFVRPPAAVDLKNDVWGDCPWVAMKFTARGRPYWVMQMDHTSNPRPAVFSTRAYGRMGALSTKDGKAPLELEAGKPLTLRYRVAVFDGKKYPRLEADRLANLYSDYVSPVQVEITRHRD